MAQAKNADRVKINFIGRLDDGSIIDSTYPDSEEGCCGDDHCGHEHGPFELTIGEGEFYVPVEEALVGMQVGEKKTVVVPVDDAFGEFDPENVFSVKRTELPDDLVPEVGLPVEVTGDDDEEYLVTIIEVTDEDVTFDSNHPLAGEELTYEVELMEIL